MQLHRSLTRLLAIVGLGVRTSAKDVRFTNYPLEPNPIRGRWIDAWTCMPQLTEPANLPPPPFNESGAVFVNTTIRQTVFLTTDASQIRVKISNAFGITDLLISAATVALSANNTAGSHQIRTSTLRKVVFSSQDSITIPSGALAVSDPLEFSIKAEQILTVTIYLAQGQKTNFITSHPGSRTTSWWQADNAVHAAELLISSPDVQSAAHWYFISSIEAWVPLSYKSFLLVGDSITDGRGSTTNHNNRWPDLLLRRLQRNASTQHIAIGNVAAGGNRILADGLGPNALSRIDRDVLAHPGVAYALIFEGVNDIGSAMPTPEAQDIIYVHLTTAYAQLASRIRAQGIPVFGATITPFSAPPDVTIQPYSNPEREKTRQRINEFIRTSRIFNAVLDFDEMLRDTLDPARLDSRYDSGDYLHPNVAGYEHLANNFPVEIFDAWREGVDGFR